MAQTSVFRRISLASLPVAGAHLALELSNNFLPLTYPLFIERIGLTYAQVGTVALVAVIAGSISQPLFGYFADRFDPRLLAVLSIAWIGTIMGLVGLVPVYWLLLVVVALGGLGSAAFHPAGAALASAVSASRRGGAMALFSIGGNLGSALSPLLIGLGLGWFGLRGTLLLVPVVWAISLALYLGLGQIPVLSHRDADGQVNVQVGPWLALALVVVMAGARSWYFGSFTTYLPEWLQNQGWSPERAGLMLSVMVGSLALGSLAGGTFSDRMGREPVMLVALGGMAPVLWLVLNAGGPALVAGVMGVGILVGATFPVVIVMAQEAWPGAVGLASSLAIGVAWLPAGIGSWVVGLVADRTSLPFALHTLLVPPLVGVAAVIVFYWRYRPR
jgi:FSR family fosmidomycin resistance protein-like MFS transporter